MSTDYPSIGRAKLESYVQANRSYVLRENGNDVELRFVPSFPEALNHLPNGEEVEHIMSGFIENERIYFTRFVTRSSFGETVTELHGEDDPMMLWLNFV